jgi:hypothetical protein
MFIGLVLIILGVVVLLLQLITFTTHVKGIHIGPFKTSAEAKTDFPVPPLFGVLVLAGGIVLVIIGRKRKPLFNQHRLTTVFGRLKHKQSHSGWECWRFLK